MSNNTYLSRTVKNLKEQFGSRELAEEIHNDRFGHEVKVEKIIVGKLLLESNMIWEISDVLLPEMFFDERLRILYGIILSLSKENKPVDMLSVVEYVRKTRPELMDAPDGVNAFYISSITDDIVSAKNIKHEALIVIQAYVAREVQRTFAVGNDMLKTEDVADVMEYVSKKFFDYENIFNTGQGAKSISELSDDAVNIYYEKLKLAMDGIKPGLSTGFDSLDKKFNLIQKDDLVIVAARPSMGKTSFAISMAVRMAQEKIPVAFFSIESSKEQITNKIASNRLGIPYSDISEAKIDNESILVQFDTREWAKLPIYIDDETELTPMKLRSKLRRLILKHGVQVAFIDYLQKMKADEKAFSRNDEIGSITGAIKGMNKEFKIPVIALAQLNRGTESGNGTRPSLGNLRHSGEIEQDADVINFIHREAYYDNEIKENERIHETEIINAKNRNGPTGDAIVFFDSHTTTFHEDGEGEMPF